jgi:hypothetical protein
MGGQASAIAGRAIVAAGLACLIHRALQEYCSNAKSDNDQDACSHDARFAGEHVSPPDVPTPLVAVFAWAGSCLQRIFFTAEAEHFKAAVRRRVDLLRNKEDQ